MIFDWIRQGDAERIRTLLAADPALANSRTPEGASTVLWAVYTRHPELAPLLLGSRPPDFFEACALGADARIVELAWPPSSATATLRACCWMPAPIRTKPRAMPCTSPRCTRRAPPGTPRWQACCSSMEPTPTLRSPTA